MTTTDTNSILVSPFGGKLIDLVVGGDESDELRESASHLPSIQLSERAVCDLELLAVGGFSPLDRFMSQADFQSVLDTMRTADGALFPIPITLPVDNLDQVTLGQAVALRDSKFNLLAVMDVEEIYEWDVDETAEKVFGSTDVAHPLVAEMQRWGKYNLSGKLQVIQLPEHPDFREYRRTPAQTRQVLESIGRRNVVAFQTRNPLHRVHEELTKQASEEVGGVLLLHPVVGLTKPGDVDHYTRVRTYKTLTENYYDEGQALLSLLPLAMRMGGPREAVWHGIIRRNFGANHLIVGRDHAGPGSDSTGKPFYGPYDAQDMMNQFSDELGVKPVEFKEFVYLPDEERYEQVSKIASGARTASISGTQVRDQYLSQGTPLPAWFTRSEVAEILAETYPPKDKQGVCIWFTGLSGAGKTATADVLSVLLMEQGKQVTVLDGDVVRTHLSKGLGFSAEDRDTNIRRIGFVASEIARHGGAVICAAISPYKATRDEVKQMVGAERFVEVFVDTPLEVCEARDSKGMYAKARRGEITGFTGIDDPYESPVDPEITLDTVGVSKEGNGQRIFDYLVNEGFVRTD
ncbi:MAG: bifunctional sulfate adenylyltransferase/adenylylsulfate kinase [SAR202 cluster bacterium]|nr:bifunctional sulfate adenylyltransferase/adenylylsulfate kinase [SAR202 cluster bacterium]